MRTNTSRARAAAHAASYQEELDGEMEGVTRRAVAGAAVVHVGRRDLKNVVLDRIEPVSLLPWKTGCSQVLWWQR